ncbi:MAG TPA: PQQ-binding-like beta-propeller repeat protein [Patescibacteria group bacterium]|nr:PQQ-binding-like beta-propeller repeat protein [Patescibacteria group bacterium]
MAKRNSRSWECFFIVLGIIAALLITGCGTKIPLRQQVTFIKEGVALNWNDYGLPESPEVFTIGLDGQQEAIKWRRVNDKIILESSWQPGTLLQARLAGQSWQGRAPQTPTPLLWSTHELGGLEQTPSVKEWSPVVYEDVAISPDGRYIGVASFDHNIYMYGADGKKMWEYRIPGGVGMTIAFAPDSLRVYVGEASAEANVYALDTATGKIIWQYAMAADIGGQDSVKWNSRPKVTGLVVSGEKVIVSAEYVQRVAIKNGERAKVKYVTACVIRSMDGTNGDGNWRYPEQGVMDTGVSKITVSADGTKLAFANHSWSRGQEYPDGGVRILNGITGGQIGFHLLAPKGGQFSYVGIFDGIDLSSNGQYLAVITADNRGMLFDAGSITTGGEPHQEMPLLWQRQVSKIQEVGGVPVYAYGNTAHTDNNGQVFFMTGATFVADKTATTGAPPFLHPDATTMFAYGNDGECLWRWQSEGGISKLRFSRDGKYAVLPVYHNYVTRQKDRAGIYCLDLQRSRGEPLVWFYPLAGVAVAVGISDRNGLIAGVEIPVRQMDDRPVGKHRLHILQ